MSVPKIEPASSKNNEMLEINVLQKFTPHALCCETFFFYQNLSFSTQNFIRKICKDHYII